MRIVLVTDSHLGPSAPACNRNWSAVREYISRSKADLTVHLGDITLDAATEASQLVSARTMCDAWPTPFRFLPGNHDIGDNPPGPDVPAKHPLETSLLERFRNDYGPDFWSLDVDHWLIIGLDAQLFGSGHEHEQEQWQWLSERVADAKTRPVALMLHKPLFQNSMHDAPPHIRYVPLAPRTRLLGLINDLDVRLVFSGHTHQYLDRTIDGVRYVWIPSTAFFIPDSDQDRIGEKITGLGLLELSGSNYTFDLVSPHGIARNSFADQPFYKHLK
jgi:3',5'-cyclic AMP phosphodiesterase CpdA